MTRWLIPLVGERNLTSEGAFWRRQRKLAQPAFQRQQIERYAAVMLEHTERMLETWADGQVRDTQDDMARLTLSIVANTLFGTDIASQADVVGRSLEVVVNRFMSPMRWFRLFDYLPPPSSHGALPTESSGRLPSPQPVLSTDPGGTVKASPRCARARSESHLGILGTAGGGGITREGVVVPAPGAALEALGAPSRGVSLGAVPAGAELVAVPALGTVKVVGV
jgi:hypothetical protein